MKVVGFNEYGYVETEFTDSDGILRSIWIEPEKLFLVNLNYIKFDGIKSYKLSSIKNGAILTQVKDRNVLTELDPLAWGEFIHKIMVLSFSSGHMYQEELWKLPLIENANVIMSSEFLHL